MSVVWVLGAAGGVGSIVCQNLSNQGWKVVGSGRTEEKLQLLSSQIDDLDVLPVDARDDVAMKQAVAKIVETHGRLDAVVVAVGSIYSDRCTLPPPNKCRIPLSKTSPLHSMQLDRQLFQ